MSVDGLSRHDAQALAKLAPNFSKLLAKHPPLKMDAGILPNAQAVWAKILTGADSFSNGCFGYSRLDESLNKLTIFKEKDLLMPPNVMARDEDFADMEQSCKSVFINVPILQPITNERLWLSDGSLPINKTVHPKELAQQKGFVDYQPRAFPNLVAAHNSGAKAGLAFIESENNRVRLTHRLLQSDKWRLLVYRCSIFDHLSHIIGMNFLDQPNLLIWSELCDFIQNWDRLLDGSRIAEDTEIIVFSPFSHEACVGTLNINEILMKNGLLELLPTNSDDQSAQSLRIAAATALVAKPISAQMTSMEGRLDLAQTTAASPISGCIYINKNTIDGGIVSQHDYSETRARIRTVLEVDLSKRFGNKFKTEENPLHYDAAFSCSSPEFLINVQGIDLNNMVTRELPRMTAPRTTHSSEGFLFSTKSDSLSEEVCPTDLVHLLDTAN